MTQRRLLRERLATFERLAFKDNFIILILLWLNNHVCEIWRHKRLLISPAPFWVVYKLHLQELESMQVHVWDQATEDFEAIHFKYK